MSGYESSKGRYVILTENELEAIDIELSRTVDLARFVDLNEVDVVYLDTPYMSLPKAKSATRRSGYCAKRWIGRVRLASGALF